MAMVTGFVLAWVGFVPNAPEQAANVGLAIRSLNGLVPLFSLVVGALLLVGFTLTAEKHAEIRAQLDARKADA